MLIFETTAIPPHLKDNLAQAIRHAARFAQQLFTEDRMIFTGEVALQMARDLCLYLDGTLPRENALAILSRHGVTLSDEENAALSVLQKESRKEEDYTACMAEMDPDTIRSLFKTLADALEKAVEEHR